MILPGWRWDCTLQCQDHVHCHRVRHVDAVSQVHVLDEESEPLALVHELVLVDVFDLFHLLHDGVELSVRLVVLGQHGVSSRSEVLGELPAIVHLGVLPDGLSLVSPQTFGDMVVTLPGIHLVVD